MSVRRIRMLTALVAVGGMVVALAAGSPTSPAAGSVERDRATWAAERDRATGALVSVGSPTEPFQQSQQSMPTMAVNPINPNVVAATANDLVDMQACSKEAAINGAACSTPANPATGGASNPGVGFSGVYFSFNSGRRWMQPTYRGLTAAGCDPEVEPCKAEPGPIHTVPNYYENGLRARGGSSVAFGPVLRNGKFSWANGSRLYLSTLGANLAATPIDPGRIDTSRAVMVSHIDDPTPARVADQKNWSKPVIVPERAPATSRPTADVIWADNASSSRYFGNVYTCYNDFHFVPGAGTGPLQPTVGVSKDGGQTWKTQGVAPPINSPTEGYRQNCTVRTDSRGGVYVFFTHFSGQVRSHSSEGAQSIMKSFDGGATWTEPVDFVKVNTSCPYVDPIPGWCAQDGGAGVADEQGPHASIANGAPTGADATDEIVFTSPDAEAAAVWYSTDRAKTWSAPTRVSRPGERVLFSAVAIAPDASRVYVTYNAFTTPFSVSPSSPRLLRGVLRSAKVRRGGEPTGWKTNYSAPSGDARGTSYGSWNYGEYLGFFITAVATRRYGAGAWIDVSRAASCPAINQWRQESLKAGKVLTPAPWPQRDCPASFGNSDIVSATTAP